MKQKALVILGPTASGKSALAIELARKYNGEIISADSRQVYRGLDIGTGKVTKKEMGGIKHYLLDVANPRKRFAVIEFKTQAENAISDVLTKGKLPIICGGTGFYIQALVDNIALPDVPPNPLLRQTLSKKSSETLMKMLKRLDPKRAKNIDPKNNRRIIRAIEIAKFLGKVPAFKEQKSNIDYLQVGIRTPDKILRGKITARLLSRIRTGMINEAKKLHKNGLTWKRMEELGLEYRYLAKYLKKFPQLSASSPRMSAMAAELETAIWHYAKRQKTWFKKDKRIRWFELSDKKKIEKEVRGFLK